MLDKEDLLGSQELLRDDNGANCILGRGSGIADLSVGGEQSSVTAVLTDRRHG